MKLRLLPVFLLILLLSSFSSTSASPVSRQDDSVATLEPIQGLVQYRAADAPEDAWETLTQRQLVAEGDWIRTDGSGLAELVFFEGVLCEILPNSQVQVTELSIEPAGTVEISLDVVIGDTHSRIDRALDAQSRYEVHTPSAIIAVRGTDFWVSTSPELESQISVLDGVVSVTGVLPDDQPGQMILLEKGNTVHVDVAGALGPVEPITILPEYPLKAALAPATCGDLICQPEEICPRDCDAFPDCGDQICDLEGGEGPVTCAVDCVRTRSDVLASCTILASQRVPVYTAPGENRPILGYLNVNESFPVIAQAVSSNDLHWWRIEMLNVREAWVNQRGITISGSCALVPMVEAVPFIAPPSRPGTATPVPTVEGTVEPAEASISFVADRTQIKAGECVTLRWDVEGIQEVYYQGQGVTGHDSRQECPRETTTYTLQVLTLNGETLVRTVTILVDEVDTDGDTVPDHQDQCPNEYGPPENNGCPLRDADSDTVPDDQDECPEVYGPPENGGCPYDSDSDTIPDDQDACPSEYGPPENGGCPIIDSDGDTVPDDQDKCPSDYGPPDNSGCPLPDYDGDTVPDTQDSCPMVYGPPENGGCPYDRDGDTVPDDQDSCPDAYGPPDNGGCPLPQ